ncbi:type III-A CRISPR-associated RAMP protein Csm3 [Sediminibacterium sp.]|uniref:type III-A CRISPR-associated RAMP protein Csm3 n=1 Tax=Sediminibacterium sp. TaxID=1917865 RepID=UPI002733BAD3|nr:type III-A CRISPR-associated RAMP protein Csm3 [Sediminibacterium sp.]MDP3566386.1 type III-A CRISPR-associated RAMP protein Csm3 [Sediminibacterium sp.]
MFKENYIIKGEIVCETGLHIGGAKESIEIGGIDNIVMRDSISKLPYIPGSSVKGKMRSLMEINNPESSSNLIQNRGNPCKCGKCLPCHIFGNSADEVNEGQLKGPTRIIVRDSFPTEDTLEKWSETDDVVGGAELKYENTLNRITSEAKPRNQERVPKDSRFNMEIVFSIFDEDDPKNLNGVFESLMLLEDNYIGGSGTRGYGKIKFENISLIKRSKDYYKGISDEEIVKETSDVKEILKSLSE